MACGYERINYWSNPIVDFGQGPIQKLNQNYFQLNQPSILLGTFNYENNAKVWNERSSEVAAFEPPEEVPFSAEISGDFFFGEGNSGQWDAVVNGGTPPYDYTWYRSYSSASGPWTQVGTSSSYNQMVNEEMWLRLSVTDNTCQGMICLGAQDIAHIEVLHCGNPPCQMPKAPGGGEAVPEAFALSQNYPNPFNPATTINYDIPERSDVRLEVFNMLGQRVALLADGQVQPGSHAAIFDASNLSSGTYLARITASGNSGEQFVQTMTMQLVK